MAAMGGVYFAQPALAESTAFGLGKGNFASAFHQAKSNEEVVERVLSMEELQAREDCGSLRSQLMKGCPIFT